MTDPIRANSASTAHTTESITFADENVRPVSPQHRTHGSQRASDQFVSDTAAQPTRARVVLSRLGQTTVSYVGMDAETQRARTRQLADHALGVALPPDPRTQLGPAPEDHRAVRARQHEHAFHAGMAQTIGAVAAVGTSAVLGPLAHGHEYAREAAAAAAQEVLGGGIEAALEHHAPSAGEVALRAASIAADTVLGMGASGAALLVECATHIVEDRAEQATAAGVQSQWEARRDAANTAVRSGRAQAEAEFQLFMRGERNGVDLDRMSRDFGYGQRMQELIRSSLSH